MRLVDFDFDTLYDRRDSDSSKWHRYDGDVLPMFVADMEFRAPEPVIAALRGRAEQGFFGYTYARPELHEAFLAYLDRTYAWTVPSETLVPMPGVIAGFNLACAALLAPGDGLLVQVPGYPPILNAAANHGIERHDASLVQDAAGRYEIDWQSFEAAIRPNTRAFLFCNPHNPTGRVFTRAEVERMAEICLSRGLFIISDEIHCDIVFGGAKHIPIASVSPEVAARTVTLMAPSKTFGLPGLKAAMAIVTDEELRTRFEGARHGLVPGVNAFGLAGMTAAYRDGAEWLRGLLSYLEANRTFLAAYVAERMPGIRLTPAEGTYLSWLDCREALLPDDDTQAFFLEKARVGVSQGTDFGVQGRGFTRLCFAAPRVQLEQALDRMSAALRVHRTGA